MRYLILDYAANTYIGPFDSREELAAWWVDHEGVHRDTGKARFDNLNVTGKDTITHEIPSGWKIVKDKDGTSYEEEVYRKVVYLRRYQVLDEYGRSIDIREWEDSVWIPEPWHPWRIAFPGWHRCAYNKQGPSMRKATLRASTEKIDFQDSDEYDFPLPLKDGTHVRTRNILSSGDAWDYPMSKHNHTSRSWKDQSKSSRQWGKLQKGHTVSVDSNAADNLFERLAAEGLPVVGLESAS